MDKFGQNELNEISSDHVLEFLNDITDGRKQRTRKTRFSHLSTFFNFISSNLDRNFQNPCEIPMMKNLFKIKSVTHFDIIEKDTIDEVIFRVTKPRNRLILELMARGGMRIGEVLALTLADIHDRKLVLKEPKSGKEFEFVFIPQKVADRLKEFAKKTCESSQSKIFPITYETARVMVKKSGAIVGIKLRPHDLRRHAATYASRSGVPIEIVSKIILRHSNLSTTQRYLGKISDTEAMRWIEHLYA